MATKTQRKPAKPKEINISKENADHIRTMTEEVMAMQAKPEVAEYIAAIEARNVFIQQVAKICNVDFGEGGWTLDMQQGKFVEQVPQNGQP